MPVDPANLADIESRLNAIDAKLDELELDEVVAGRPKKNRIVKR